jgi:hypothetical protein
MASIYRQVHCVIFWIGKSADESSQVTEAIRIAGYQTAASKSINEAHEKLSKETDSETAEDEMYANYLTKKQCLRCSKGFRRI